MLAWQTPGAGRFSPGSWRIARGAERRGAAGTEQELRAAGPVNFLLGGIVVKPVNFLLEDTETHGGGPKHRAEGEMGNLHSLPPPLRHLP